MVSDLKTMLLVPQQLMVIGEIPTLWTWVMGEQPKQLVEAGFTKIFCDNHLNFCFNRFQQDPDGDGAGPQPLNNKEDLQKLRKIRIQLCRGK